MNVNLIYLYVNMNKKLLEKKNVEQQNKLICVRSVGKVSYNVMARVVLWSKQAAWPTDVRGFVWDEFYLATGLWVG